MEITNKIKKVKMVEIYTDGSLTKKDKKDSTGRGGWAYVVMADGKRVNEFYGSSEDVTISQMEIKAFQEALDYAVFLNTGSKTDVVINSDSQYVVKTYNEWMEGWAKKDWKKSSGPIAHLDIWKELYTLKRHIEGSDANIIVKWVKAHDGTEGNEIADDLAFKAARSMFNVSVERLKRLPVSKDDGRMFRENDLIIMGYPHIEYNRHKQEDVFDIWKCIQNINSQLTLEFAYDEILIKNNGSPVCSSQLDESHTRTLHDVLYKYWNRHYVRDLIEK